MRRYLLSLLLVLGFALPASAQLGSVPFVFTSGTVISSSEVNQNFSTIYSNALNRTGGTMTGTFNARDILAVTDNTYDIGSAAFAFQDGFFDGVMTMATAVVSSTGASALDVAGGINAGSGNVGIVDTTGKIPAISSTYFASLSGANLTSIPETAITDGSLLARVGSSETISSSWTFAAQTIINNNVALVTKNSGGTTVNLANIDNSNNYNFGSSNGAQVSNTILAAGSAIDFQTNGNSRANFDSVGGFNHLGPLTLSNTISPTALSTGNNNNYNPTGLSTAYLVRLDGGAGSPVLTGMAGGVAGRILVLCRVAGSGISIAAEDANSTAANRFTVARTLLDVSDGDCAQFIYDGTSSRWRPIAVTQ
jgi:hypothetical protein